MGNQGSCSNAESSSYPQQVSNVNDTELAATLKNIYQSLQDGKEVVLTSSLAPQISNLSNRATKIEIALDQFKNGLDTIDATISKFQKTLVSQIESLNSIDSTLSVSTEGNLTTQFTTLQGQLEKIQAAKMITPKFEWAVYEFQDVIIGMTGGTSGTTVILDLDRFTTNTTLPIKIPFMSGNLPNENLVTFQNKNQIFFSNNSQPYHVRLDLDILLTNGERDMSFEIRDEDGKTVSKINRQVDAFGQQYRLIFTTDFDVLKSGFYNLIVVNPLMLMILSFSLRAVVTRIV